MNSTISLTNQSNSEQTNINQANTYTDPSGNLYKRCNVTINSAEYYEDDSKVLGTIGGIVSLPFIISSIICSSCFISVFLAIAVSAYNSSSNGKDGGKSITGGMILAIICCLSCVVLLVYNIISYNTAQKQIITYANDPNSRPCYSTTQQKVIK